MHLTSLEALTIMGIYLFLAIAWFLDARRANRNLDAQRERFSRAFALLEEDQRDLYYKMSLHPRLTQTECRVLLAAEQADNA